MDAQTLADRMQREALGDEPLNLTHGRWCQLAAHSLSPPVRVHARTADIAIGSRARACAYLSVNSFGGLPGGLGPPGTSTPSVAHRWRYRSYQWATRGTRHAHPGCAGPLQRARSAAGSARPGRRRSGSRASRQWPVCDRIADPDPGPPQHPVQLQRRISMRQGGSTAVMPSIQPPAASTHANSRASFSSRGVPRTISAIQARSSVQAAAVPTVPTRYSMVGTPQTRAVAGCPHRPHLSPPLLMMPAEIRGGGRVPAEVNFARKLPFQWGRWGQWGQALQTRAVAGVYPRWSAPTCRFTGGDRWGQRPQLRQRGAQLHSSSPARKLLVMR